MSARETRVTNLQLEKMLQFMKEHPDFSYGKLLGPQGKKKNQELWETLAVSLNALGCGPTKPASKWQKCWSDWKANTKKKAIKMKAHARATGGGPPSIQQLSPIEENLLDWMAPESLEGDSNIAEAGGFTDLPLQIIPAEEEVVMEILPSTSESQPLRDVTECGRVPETVQQPKQTSSQPKRRIGHFGDLVEVEEKRAKMESGKLELEERRLKIEEDRLALEKQRLALDEKLVLMKEREEERKVRQEARESERDERRTKALESFIEIMRNHLAK